MSLQLGPIGQKSLASSQLLASRPERLGLLESVGCPLHGQWASRVVHGQGERPEESGGVPHRGGGRQVTRRRLLWRFIPCR